MIRKTLSLGLLLAVCALPVTAEMTLEEVLKAHHEAIGGVEAWESWKTVRMTGEMSMGGGQMTAPFNMVFANDGKSGKSRLEFTVQGMTGIMSYDGETAWQVMPFQGVTEPQPLPEQQQANLEEQSDFAGPLIHPDKKGVTLEYLGTEEVEGTPAHKIQVTRANGELRTLYLDSEAFVPIKAAAKTMVQGQEVELETTYGDYKEVAGRVFAHSFETRGKGQPEGSGQAITINEVEFDVDVPDDYFAMPEKAAAAADG